MTMSPGAQQEAFKFKIAETNAKIADLEAKARSRSSAPLADTGPTVARKVRNETIGGILLLVCIAVAVFMLFFVL